MGGRGGSGGGRGGSSTKVYEQSGGYIDLKDSPLQYGRKDDMLKGKQRTTIEEFEKNRVNEKVEHSRTVSKNGNVIAERKGGKGSVELYTRDGENGQVGSHNHPRESGVLGGTFSNADIEVFTSKSELNTIRATTKEGTYSMSKGQNFDAAGLLAYKQQERKRLVNIRKQTYRAIDTAQARGDITYSKSVELKNRAFNKFLVDVHNSLLAGQSKYGYTYTLERNRGRRK